MDRPCKYKTSRLLLADSDQVTAPWVELAIIQIREAISSLSFPDIHRIGGGHTRSVSLRFLRYSCAQPIISLPLPGRGEGSGGGVPLLSCHCEGAEYATAAISSLSFPDIHRIGVKKSGVNARKNLSGNDSERVRNRTPFPISNNVICFASL